MILDEKDAKRILEKVISYSKADAITATLSGMDSYNIRFALNSLSTNGFSDGLSLSVTSDFGKKSGSASTNKFDDESVKEVVKKSEQISKLSPDNREYMPLLGQQVYPAANNYSEATEKNTSDNRALLVSGIIDESVNHDVSTAGFLEDDFGFLAVMNSNGLFAYNKGTMSSLSATVRTKSGTGSSRFEKSYVNVNDFNTNSLTGHVIERAKLSEKPGEIPPGRYTVILEPAAVADMVALCLNFMNARQADEGRSFFSKQGGGNKINEQLAKENVNIYSDPTDINAPSTPFGRDGFTKENITWFENGVLKNLHRSRYWAEKTSAKAIAYPSNVIMKGTEKSLEQMIAESDNAILVTRFWYIRTVENSSMLLTGLTRDGVFEIKNGKITRPVKNFRFNESPVNVLANVLDIGKAEKSMGAETGNMQIFVPPLKIANFNFSSLSDAI